MLQLFANTTLVRGASLEKEVFVLWENSQLSEQEQVAERFPWWPQHHSCEPTKLKKSLWGLCTEVSKDKQVFLSSLYNTKPQSLSRSFTSVCKEILKENRHCSLTFLTMCQFLVIKAGKICVSLNQYCDLSQDCPRETHTSKEFWAPGRHRNHSQSEVPPEISPRSFKQLCWHTARWWLLTRSSDYYWKLNLGPVLLWGLPAWMALTALTLLLRVNIHLRWFQYTILKFLGSTIQW